MTLRSRLQQVTICVIPRNIDGNTLALSDEKHACGLTECVSVLSIMRGPLQVNNGLLTRGREADKSVPENTWMGLPQLDFSSLFNVTDTLQTKGTWKDLPQLTLSSLFTLFELSRRKSSSESCLELPLSENPSGLQLL